MGDLLNIFGLSVKLALEDSPSASTLRKDLALYPRSLPDSDCDIEIVQGEISVPASGFVNPTIHTELDDGFIARFGSVDVQWDFNNADGLRRVKFELASGHHSPLRRGFQRMRSMQYTTPVENVGQVFHELVLIPSAYFIDGRFLLHASGLKAPDGGVTLIGGTGGVGKTSLELKLCRHHGYTFVADDVVVVEEGGHVWPNLAFPKIYGYNLEGDHDLSRRILGNRTHADRVHWRMHAQRGLDRVRRRVSPLELYGEYSVTGGNLHKYIFISREFREDFLLEKVSAEKMAAVSLPVIKAEYEVFHRHLEWHHLNRILMDNPSKFSPTRIFERWVNSAANAFQSVSCYIVHAPKVIGHNEFQLKMADLVSRS